MDILANLALGFSIALEPKVLAYAFIGCLFGTLVGMLPGVGPLTGISLLLPVTYGLNPTIAIVMLAGVYYGAMYGGDRKSTRLNSSHVAISYAVFCLKKKTNKRN